MTAISWPLMKNNIERKDLDELIEYLRGTDPKLTHGDNVKQFEEEWSKWLGVGHSCMVNSGSSANDLTMLALRESVGAGEIIVPALTWVSDVASVLHAGLKPIFVDINPSTLGLDTEKVLASITEKTKAVFITHVLGLNALTDKLINELKRLDIKLIEDVCESHGATFKGKKLGTYGFASNFSFYYAHHMTTIEGGMISSDDEDFIDLIRMLRSHGLLRESKNSEKINKYKLDFPDLNPEFIFGYHAHNMRPTEINGILGLSQLKRLDENVKIRTDNFSKFLDKVEGKFFQKDFSLNGSSNYAFILILKEPSFENRDKVERVMHENGIEFRRGLSGGGNQLRQPYLKNLLEIPKPDSLVNTDYVHNFGWYIGNYPGISSTQIENLTDILNRALDG